MSSFSTEVTSSKIISDNPLFQRTFKAYEIVAEKVKGHTLEIGCGEGYGIKTYINNTAYLMVIDKSKTNLKRIKAEHPSCEIYNKKIPPLSFIKNDAFDTVISFQVIEHIKDYHFFIKELHRVLKPGGKAYITTPNKEKTVVRNPWHFKEFSYNELDALFKTTFNNYKIQGVNGNKKTDQYYQKSNASVKKILAIDILGLNKILPRSIVKIPYEIFNRLNRLLLYKKDNNLIQTISKEDYKLNAFNENTLDFFCVLEK